MNEEKKPLLIQIDDEVREMTADEIVEYEKVIADMCSQPLPSAD